MAVTGIGNTYNNVYEGIYASSQRETVKKEETKAAAGTQKSARTAEKSSNEEYLKSLQKQVPYIKLQIGYGLNAQNDGKVNVVDVSPKLLEKMQNDPKAAKEYTQRLKDVEAATKWVDNYYKSIGCTTVVRHGYVDENGNFSNFSITIRKDELNEKLRKEAQENAEKQIEKSREKARENTEALIEKSTSSKSKSTAEYAVGLAKLVPSVEFRVGNTFASNQNGKTLTVNPQLLEKMQNNPETEKEMTELIKGVESMTKLIDSINKATGRTVVFRHGYIDENGQYRQVSLTRNDFMLNMSDKLREERRENAEKLLEKQKEKAADNEKAVQEKLEEKSEETKEEKLKETKEEKLEEYNGSKVQQYETVNTQEETKEAKEVIKEDEALIEKAQEEKAGKLDTKGQMTVGANLDLQV